MKELIRHTNVFEIGVDEAGRGCLAGPVVAASFMPGPAFVPPKGLNDSKKMTEKAREYCYEYAVEHYGDRIGVGMTHHDVIDRINILRATMGAMNNAVVSNPTFKRQYATRWQVTVAHNILLLIDGNRFERMVAPVTDEDLVSVETVIKGDSIYQSIAMASVIAKVTRDRHIVELAKLPAYEMYGWDKNKGYGTSEHVAAIIKYGRSDLHRKTFRVPGYPDNAQQIARYS